MKLPCLLAVLLAVLAAPLAAQYAVLPAAAPYTPIAGTTGSVMLPTVSACDDCTETLNLSFGFSWFGNAPQTSVVVSSNGAVTFDGATDNFCCSPWALDNGQSGGTPSYFAQVARASVLQEDLHPSAFGDIWALDNGASVIISWENVAFYSNSGNAQAQIELFASGEIEIRYGTITNLTNNVACGLTNPVGGVTTWFSPQAVLPQFNAVGQTTGAVVPQNTGVRFAPSGAEFQLNTPAARLEVDGVVGGTFSRAVTNANINQVLQVTLASTAVGTNHDLGVVVGPLTQVAAGAIVTPGGQVVNLDIFDPSLFFLFGGALPLTSLNPFPGAGTYAIPFSSPAPLVASAQLVVASPFAQDGFSLSQGSEVRVVADPSLGTGFPTCIPGAGLVPLTDNGFSQQSLGFGFTFFGTTYTQVFIGSNGHCTFNGGDPFWPFDAAGLNQAQFPMIAACGSDLDPGAGGSVTFFTDNSSLFEICWTNVPSVFSTDQNSFKITCSSAGFVVLDYGNVDTTSAVVGLSAGSFINTVFPFNMSAAGGFNGPVAIPAASTPCEVFVNTFDLDNLQAVWLLDGNGNPLSVQ